jgi:hypothetical protein
MAVSAEREQYERALGKQSRLGAAADAHARDIADRDRFVRELAASLPGLPAPPLPPEGPLSPEDFKRCAAGRFHASGTLAAAHVQHWRAASPAAVISIPMRLGSSQTRTPLAWLDSVANETGGRGVT